MGSILSILWSGRAVNVVEYDVPDPYTGLTPRQKKFVCDTWQLVKKDIKGNGIELFIRFFELRPEAQNRFSSFVGVSLKELRLSKRLQAHTNSVMYALDGVVMALDDPEVLHEMLLKIGINHGRRGVTKEEFNVLKTVLMNLLKEKLDIHVNSDGEEAWSKTIDVFYRSMFQGMDSRLWETTNH